MLGSEREREREREFYKLFDGEYCARKILLPNTHLQAGDIVTSYLLKMSSIQKLKEIQGCELHFLSSMRCSFFGIISGFLFY